MKNLNLIVLAFTLIINPTQGHSAQKSSLPSLEKDTSEVYLAKRKKRQRSKKRKTRTAQSRSSSSAYINQHKFLPSALLGLTLPSTEGLSAAFGFGMDGLYNFGNDYTAGGFFMYSGQELSSITSGSISASADLSFLPIGITGGINLWKGLNLSGALGLSIVSASATITISGSSSTISSSTSDFFIGAKASYYYALPWVENLYAVGDIRPLLVLADTSYMLLNMMVGASYGF